MVSPDILARDVERLKARLFRSRQLIPNPRSVLSDDSTIINTGRRVISQKRKNRNNRKYYLTHKDKQSNRCREYYLANKEQIKARRRERMSDEEFRARKREAARRFYSIHKHEINEKRAKKREAIYLEAVK